MFIRLMFSRKWLMTTILVLVGSGICIRLGVWQLDRLEQRRFFNTHVKTMRSLPAMQLNEERSVELENMEWRSVEANGRYDFEYQIALRNQYHGDEYGYHLITPLMVEENEAVFVDRGWIPAEGNSSPVDWRKYDEPGIVYIQGQLRLGAPKPVYGGIADPTISPGQGKLEVWNNLDLAQIKKQIPYPILPVYIQQNEDEGDTDPPVPFQPELDLSEGPHLSYALQWFSFAVILLAGYPFYLRKQERIIK